MVPHSKCFSLIDTESGEASAWGVAQRRLTKAFPVPPVIRLLQAKKSRSRSLGDKQSKTGGNNENTLPTCPCRIGNQLCSADLRPTEGRSLIHESVQQRDLLGVAKALDEFGELHQALDEAYNKNDAAAVAALFTKDALLVEPDGLFSGRQAIEKRYADTFQQSPIISFNYQPRAPLPECNRQRGLGGRTMDEVLFKARLVPYLRWATGQRFMFVRVMLGRSACGLSTRRHRRLRVLRQSRREDANVLSWAAVGAPHGQVGCRKALMTHRVRQKSPTGTQTHSRNRVVGSQP